MSVCFSEPHSSAALKRHVENHSGDGDVKHRCIKTMTHSAKAAIIDIKPGASNPSPEWFNESSPKTMCALYMFNLSAPLVAVLT